MALQSISPESQFAEFGREQCAFEIVGVTYFLIGATNGGPVGVQSQAAKTTSSTKVAASVTGLGVSTVDSTEVVVFSAVLDSASSSWSATAPSVPLLFSSVSISSSCCSGSGEEPGDECRVAAERSEALESSTSLFSESGAVRLSVRSLWCVSEVLDFGLDGGGAFVAPRAALDEVLVVDWVAIMNQRPKIKMEG
jgi:hypothetical protein